MSLGCFFFLLAGIMMSLGCSCCSAARSGRSGSCTIGSGAGGCSAATGGHVGSCTIGSGGIVVLFIFWK